jgi:DNA anti-recombination protein RmuC
MYFRLYNKAAGSINSSNTQIVIDTPTIQQLATQNIIRNTTQPPVKSNYNFMVRKDNLSTNRQMYDAYMYGVSYLNTRHVYKSKNYINELLKEDVTIEQMIDEKVNSYDLTQNVTQIVQNYNAENGINNVSSINQAIQNAIDALKAEKQQLLNDINIHSYQAISLMNQNMNNTIQNINNSVNGTLQTALLSLNTNTNSLNNTISNINVNLNNSLQQAVTIFNTNNSSLNAKLDQALASIDNKTQQALDEIIASGNSSSTINNALQEALTTISTEKQQALAQINISAYNAISNITNLVDDDSFVYEIKNELLQKIDYIFEMFFHANSNIIMENYPL